ncbi:Proteasome adapter and scaffold protein ECM29 [Taenia solium]|eukprot:TsM_000282400 transcript=TsM_000282400 gene=TsM_000282400
MGSVDESYNLQSGGYVGSMECTRAGTDIERLALRISLASIDEQFEKVIQKSLVFILRYLAKYDDHRRKLLELLGDVTRRLKRRLNIQLPVHELFVAYNDPENSTYLTNFSHMYIRLGYPRLPIAEQICLLPVLFASLTENKPIVQRDVLLHLTLPIIGGVPADARNRLELELHELPMQRRFINEFYSLVLLLPYTLNFFIMRYSFSLFQYKVAIVQFYSRGFFPTDESIVPLLFADADSRHSVVSAANKEVRMLSVLVDWENEALLSRIFDWYLGRRREFDPKGLSDLRQPLSAGVRIKLGHFLLRSRITLTGTLAPDLIEAAVLSLKGVTSCKEPAKPLSAAPSQQQQPSQLVCPTHGMKTEQPQQQQQQQQQQPLGGPASASVPATQCTHRTGQSVQRRLANHGLDLLAHLLDNATSIPPDASVRALGSLIEFVYEGTSDELVPARARGFELLSRFLSREPNYLLKDPSQLPRLFDVLSEDIAPDLKTAAAHCLRRLAFTFQEAQRQNYPALRNQLAKLERLLFENMERADPVSRLVAVHFAGIIYPPDHIPTRYLILQALGDKDQRVRNEARMVFSIFLDPNIANDIVYGRVKLPSFVEFVNHDTQHIRKNPFIDVERLIPVVQFIRLCLLAVKGGLTSAQEKEMIYETDDEIRYRINQNVRYLLSLAAPSSTAAGSSAKVAEGCINSDASATATHSGLLQPNPEQARRSIATYFRLIHVVIFARCQSPWDSPEFPNFMEEVLINNTRELAVGGKNILDQINNLLLGTSRGANCRHACASIFSAVTMETEQPAEALQTAIGMLEKVPKGSVMVDGESSHHIQGMMMGVAYLLKHLHDRHCSPPLAGSTATANTTGAIVNGTGGGGGGGGKSKKSKKQDSKNKQHMQTGIAETIEKFLKIIDAFLIRPTLLVDKPLGSSKEKSGHHQEKEGKNAAGSGVRYVTTTVAQATVTTLLEALAVLAQAGCLANLPAGSTVPNIEPSGALPSCGESKANLVARVALYLTLPPSPVTSTTTGTGAANTSAANRVSEEPLPVMAGHQRVWFATLRTLACFCTGEPPDNVTTAALEKGTEQRVSTHPHLMFIIEAMSKMQEVRDPALQLAVGAAMADALLGTASPYKGLWFERTYPLRVPPGASEAAARSPAGRWLAERFVALLTHKPGQVKPPPAMLAVSLWALAMARRFAPPPVDLLPPELFINLLTENDEALQCVAASILGLIYDRNDEAARMTLVDSLNKMIADGKRPNTSVFRELCGLAHQIGRDDMSLSLVVLATTSPPPSVNASVLFQPVNALDGASVGPANCPATAAVTTPWLTLCAVACAGLVRRLGRSLAPALPRLVPRVFIRRYDMARPRMRNAMQKIWLGLILYATSNSASNGMANSSAASKSDSGGSSAAGPAASPATITTTWESGNLANVSVNALASELVEANFNAILCEIKAQLGLTSTTKSKTPTSPPSSSAVLGTNSTPDPNLRDACCLATVALTEHPSAYKQFAAHLPSLLSGLLAMVDAEQTSDDAGLMIRALDDPSCRDVATGLLPRLLPILISRALSTAAGFSSADAAKLQHPQPPITESRSLALDLLLAAARVASPASLKNALPQLTVAGLQTMASLTPNRVVSVMRPSTLPCALPPQHSHWNSNLTSSNTTSRELQMAEVLRLCVRLIDESSLSQLVMPLVELIRAGGGTGGGSSAAGGSRGTGANSVTAVATATCIFLSHLALSSSSSSSSALITQSSPQSKKEESDGDDLRSRMVSPLSQHTGKLLAALLGALPNAGRQLDNLGRKTVQEEMAQAVALLLRFAKDTSVAKVFTRVRSWFMETSASGQYAEGVSSGSGHWACVRVMHAIARCCPDLLFAHPGLTLPLIFINTQSEAEVLQLASLPNGPSVVEPPSASLTSMPFSPATALLDDDDEEVNARRALWKETWREILPVSHANAAAANATATSSVNTTAGDVQQPHLCLPAGYSASGVCPLADLLKPPLLTTFISTLSEALIRSPSWFVRNQAALALLSVSAAIVSQPMFLLTTVASSMLRDATASDRGNTMAAAATFASAPALQVSKTQTAGPGVQQSSASETQQENDNEEEDEEEAEDEEVGDDDEDEEDEDEEEEEEGDEEDEQDEEENEAVFLIWCELARVLIAALKETGSWSGKVYLLRTVRMLTQTALERVFSLDDPSNELINEMWSVLVRETRAGRSEHAGPSYQAEAFWALASFAEICGRDATGLTEVKEKDDRLTRLLRLILPNGIPNPTEQQASSKKGKQTQFQISQELSEAEQELAIKAVGIMWPLQTKQPHVDRFVDTLHHLIFLISQGGWRIQSAALGSILAMFAKLRAEQGEELVEKASEGGGNPLEKLGLKELMNRLKRCTENTKSPVLREHALGAIASILRHRSFVTLIHSQLEDLVQSYVNCGTSNMREWACALMKSL